MDYQYDFATKILIERLGNKCILHRITEWSVLRTIEHLTIVEGEVDFTGVSMYEIKCDYDYALLPESIDSVKVDNYADLSCVELIGNLLGNRVICNPESLEMVKFLKVDNLELTEGTELYFTEPVNIDIKCEVSRVSIRRVNGDVSLRLDWKWLKDLDVSIFEGRLALIGYKDFLIANPGVDTWGAGLFTERDLVNGEIVIYKMP